MAPSSSFDDRRGDSRPRRAERAQRVVAHHPQLDPGVDEPRPRSRGPRSRRLAGAAITASSSRSKPICWAEGGDAALERRACPSPPSSLAGRADDVRGVGAGVLEEDLAELGGAGHLHDRPHLDARLAHRHQQVGEAAMALGARLGAADHEAPVGVGGERGPDLLAVDRHRRRRAARACAPRRGPSRRRARSTPGTTAPRRAGSPAGSGAAAPRCRTRRGSAPAGARRRG